MSDVTQLGGFLDWIFNTFKNDFFGSQPMMVFFVITAMLVLLVIMNASKFVFVGFFASCLIGLGYFGFMYMAWIPIFAWVIIGLSIGLIVLATIRLI